MGAPSTFLHAVSSIAGDNASLLFSISTKVIISPSLMSRAPAQHHRICAFALLPLGQVILNVAHDRPETILNRRFMVQEIEPSLISGLWFSSVVLRLLA